MFSVTSESEIPDAATAHRTLPWKVEQIKATDGSDVLLAGKPDVLYPGQTVTFAGRGAPDRNMTVKLTLSRGDRKRTLSWSPSDRTTSPMTPRLYGQIAVNQLEANAWSRKHAKPYALHFRIPGETSSLLMLENEEDYQQFDIEPEENRSFIRTSPVRQLLNRRDRKSARPDTPLFTLLDRLEQTQHEVSLPASLRRLLEKKPSSFFSVDPRPLSTTVRTYDQLRNRYREALSDGEVSYDDVYEQVHRLRGDNRTDDAVRALSSLIEQHPGHTGHLRDVGYTLMAWEQPAHAYHLLLRSAMKRPGEPQVYLACARLLEQTGNVLQALAFYEIAHRGEWHDRFQQFQTVVAMEYNRFLEEHSGRSLPEEVSELISERKRGFRTATDLNSVDVATWIVWNTDRSDVDLHVEESTGEECYYENRTTDIGGWLTKDVTQGYGPELYVLEQAKPGAYEIWANYYSSTDDRVELRTRVFALVYRREPDGTLNTRRTVLTLDGTSDYEYIDEFEFRNEVQK